MRVCRRKRDDGTVEHLEPGRSACGQHPLPRLSAYLLPTFSCVERLLSREHTDAIFVLLFLVHEDSHGPPPRVPKRRKERVVQRAGPGVWRGAVGQPAWATVPCAVPSLIPMLPSLWSGFP